MSETRSPSGEANLRAEVAGLKAQATARFDEVFRRLGLVEETSGEARDNTKEIITTLREQNALAKIEAVRAECSGIIAAMRQDVVHANKAIRDDVDKIATRVDALEELRAEGAGGAKVARWMIDALKVVAGMGAGSIIIKLLEHL